MQTDRQQWPFSFETISPGTLAGLRDTLAREVFQVQEVDERMGRKRFEISADNGTMRYQDPERLKGLSATKPTVLTDEEAARQAQLVLQEIRKTTGGMEGLRQILRGAELLPPVELDRVEQLTLDQLGFGAEGANNALGTWFWRVRYKVRLPERSTLSGKLARRIIVRGAELTLDLAWNGIPLQYTSNVLPILPPTPERPYDPPSTVADTSTTSNLKNSPIVDSSLADAEPAVAYSYNPSSGRYTQYYLEGELPRTESAVGRGGEESSEEGEEIDEYPEPTLDGDINVCIYLMKANNSTVTDAQMLAMQSYVISDIQGVWNSHTYFSRNGVAVRINVTINCEITTQVLQRRELHEYLIIVGNSGARSHIHSAGWNSGYFDISILRNTNTHTAAHEFGHLLGLEDRYHYFQRFKNTEIVSLLSCRGNRSWRNLWTCCFNTVPMILPCPYDDMYQWNNNLYSDFNPRGHVGGLLTNVQLGVALLNYQSASLMSGRPVEILPVYQYTFLGNRTNDYGSGAINVPLGVTKPISGIPGGRALVLKGDVQDGLNFGASTLIDMSNSDGGFIPLTNNISGYFNPTIQVLRKRIGVGNELGFDLFYRNSKTIDDSNIPNNWYNQRSMIQPYL